MKYTKQEQLLQYPMEVNFWELIRNGPIMLFQIGLPEPEWILLT